MSQEKKQRGFARKEFIRNKERIVRMREEGCSIEEIYQTLKDEGKITMSKWSLYSQLRKLDDADSPAESKPERNCSSSTDDHAKRRNNSLDYRSKSGGKILGSQVDPNDVDLNDLD